MVKIILTYFLLILSKFSFVFGQNIFGVSSRSSSLGSSITIINDLSLLGLNPCAMLSVKNFECSMQYVNLSELSELQQKGLQIAKPVKKGVIGMYANSFGVNAYKVVNVGVNYALLLNDYLEIGVGLGMKYTSIQQYENRMKILFSLALKGKVTEKLTYGVVLNSLGNEQKIQQGLNPTYLFAGVKFKPSTNVFLMSELDKSLFSPIRWKFACEYFATNQLVLRTGIIASTIQLSGGVGIVVKKHVRFDFGSTWQPILGVGIQVGISYSFKEKNWNE